MSSDRSNSDTSADSGAGSAAGGEETADPDSSADQPARGDFAARPSDRRDLQIQNPCGYREVVARQLRPWLEGVLRELAPEATTATVRFVSDREMHRLNLKYRGFDKSTDVLSFPGDLPPRPEAARSTGDAEAAVRPVMPFIPDQEPHLGDIVVSVPTARRQAVARGDSVGNELQVLVLHGILHCLGYDHEHDDGTMERVEAGLRRRLLVKVA